MPVPVSSRLTAAASVAVGALVAAGLFAAGPAPAADGPRASSTEATAPAFLVASSTRGESLPRPRSVTGPSSIVKLQTSLLPRHAEGQPIRFDLGRQAVTGTFTHIEHNPAYTAWTGSLDVDLGTFTIVRSGAVYRASIASPQGLWEVTRAEGSLYWLTAVPPYAGPRGGADTITQRPTRAQRQQPVASRTAAAAGSERRQARIDVLFAYTAAAKAAAGSKAALKAAVGQAAAVTNVALANSGVKAQIRVKGLAKVKGTESNNVIKDLRRLQRPHDGRFDSALRARAKHHADIVHLFTGGPSDRLCGAGALPITSRYAVPVNGVSTSYLSCLPYIVATHELGHNLGADHISYPGVTHYSKIRGSYGWYDVPHHFITAMGYYDPCEDVGDFTCVRIPYFSNPKGNFYGLAIGAKKADNAKVIKRLAPIVARYAR
jgi:hypothetical protein